MIFMKAPGKLFDVFEMLLLRLFVLFEQEARKHCLLLPDLAGQTNDVAALVSCKRRLRLHQHPLVLQWHRLVLGAHRVRISAL